MSSKKEVDCLAGCEVGGHCQGFGAVGLDLQKVLGSVLSEGSKARSTQNYMTIWEDARADDPHKMDVPSLSLHVDPKVVQLSSPALEPQLVITVFEVTHGQRCAFLVLGNLHVRIPSASGSPSYSTRQRMVKEAMNHMELVPAYVASLNRGASQPAALVLVGDCNLDLDMARQCTQLATGEPDVFTSWHVQASNAMQGGDVLFCKGAYTTAFDIPIGFSYEDRGMRHDAHDCFCICVTFPVSGKSKKRSPLVTALQLPAIVHGLRSKSRFAPRLLVKLRASLPAVLLSLQLLPQPRHQGSPAVLLILQLLPQTRQQGRGMRSLLSLQLLPQTRQQGRGMLSHSG